MEIQGGWKRVSHGHVAGYPDTPCDGAQNHRLFSYVIKCGGSPKDNAVAESGPTYV